MPAATTGRSPAGEPGGDRRFEAVIFDLDGVITETSDQHAEGWRRLATDEGWAFDDRLADELRGVGRLAALDRILAHNGVEASEEERTEWADRKNRYYVDSLAELSPDDLLPGARELVVACKDAGLAVAIGSASRNARLVLDRLGITDLFDTISDGYSAERPKPAPDVFLHAAEELGVPPERCVVVEDAASGVDAARAGGMVAVGIGPPDRVGHADHVVATVGELRLDTLLQPPGDPG